MFNLEWIDGFLPSPEGVALKEKNAKRENVPHLNDKSEGDKVRTPGDAAIDLEKQIDDNEKTQLERPNEGKNPGKGDKKRILKGGHGTE